MHKGKYESNRRRSTGRRTPGVKGLVLVLTLMLLVGAAVGGTVAWLTADSGNITNVFSASNINVTLTETNRTYQMIPGWTISKDPKAAAGSESVDCYLFVKVAKSANFDSFMTYEIADGWTALSGEDGVYYRVFDSKDSTNTNVKGTAYSILKNDQVKVKDSVTSDMMDALTATTQPTLTFTAYASQLYATNTSKFTAAAAWGNITP